MVSYKGNGNYVARNLDVAFSHNEEAVFVAKNVEFESEDKNLSTYLYVPLEREEL